MADPQLPAPWITDSPRWEMKLLDLKPHRLQRRSLLDAGLAPTMSTIDEIVFGNGIDYATKFTGGTLSGIKSNVRNGVAFTGASGLSTWEHAQHMYDMQHRYHVPEDNYGRRHTEEIVSSVISANQRDSDRPAQARKEEHSVGPVHVTLPIPSLQRGASLMRERPIAYSNIGPFQHREPVCDYFEEPGGRKSVPGLNNQLSQIDALLFSESRMPVVSPRGAQHAGSSGGWAPAQADSGEALRRNAAFSGAFGRTSAEEAVHFTSRHDFVTGEFKGRRRVGARDVADQSLLQGDATHAHIVAMLSPRASVMPQASQWAGSPTRWTAGADR